MAAKKISILNKFFATQSNAQQHYSAICKSISANNKRLEKGEDFEEIHDIYKQYCQLTNYKIQRLENITGFTAAPIIKENLGSFNTTICFYTHFSDGTSEDFSIYKALKTIADHQNQ